MKKTNKICVYPDITVKEALKQLDFVGLRVLFVINRKGELLGSITDGDIRRFILSDGNLEEEINSVYNHKPYYLVEDNYDTNSLKKLFIDKKIEVVPIIDDKGMFFTYCTWDSMFTEEKSPVTRNLTCMADVPVVIMAGGKGTRLKPFTDVLPKPLVPIKERPIMDWIIDKFVQYGAKTFFSTLNYRGKMIEAYYSSVSKNYSIDFVWEDDFYGTAGSLKLLRDKIDTTFVVSNCDIIVTADYCDVLNFHRQSNAYITVLSSIQHSKIPYGVIEFSDGGVVSKILEKPEFSHVINTGVYVLQEDCLDYIPEGRHFHITELIENLINDGKKVVTYPVNEKEYIDIGQIDDYKNVMKDFDL